MPLVLYTTENGERAFVSTPEAYRRMLVKSYLPAEEEARQAAERRTLRGGVRNDDVIAQLGSQSAGVLGGKPGVIVGRVEHDRLAIVDF